MSVLCAALLCCSCEAKVKEYKVKVKDFVFLVEIDDLPGRAKLEGIAPVKSLIHVTEG